jgi:hypothetical protein
VAIGGIWPDLLENMIFLEFVSSFVFYKKLIRYQLNNELCDCDDKIESLKMRWYFMWWCSDDKIVMILPFPSFQVQFCLSDETYFSS